MAKLKHHVTETTTIEHPATTEANGAPPSRKTACPISREQFRKAAKPLLAQIEGQPIAVPTKEFKPSSPSVNGSLGYYQQGKVTLVIDGIPCVCQCSISLQIVGSKELPA